MPFGNALLSSLFLDVAHADDTVETWHLPVVEREGRVSDAADEPGSLRGVLDRLRPSDPEFTLLRPLPALARAELYGGEQSNTSIFFGAVLLKCFRRLEEGDNIDAELHEVLTGTGLVAELHGVWRHGSTVLGLVLEAFTDPLDGFVLACDHARADQDFTGHARAIGSSLAELHHALAARLPTSRANTMDLRPRLVSDFTARAAEVPELETARAQMERHLALLGDEDYPTQRIHGDAHLGQVLLTRDGWRWVDFEGEPMRSIAERRMPDSPLRDLAGMLRSFAYAGAHAAGAGWEAACREALLDGYGRPSGGAQHLLRAYEMDKASYEVVYETRNRPGWVRIPMRAFTKG